MTIPLVIFTVIVAVGLCAWTVKLVASDARTRDRAWEKKEASWAAERDQLLNRIMFLAGNPWQEHVAEEVEPEADDPDAPYDPTMEPIRSEYDFYPSGTV